MKILSWMYSDAEKRRNLDSIHSPTGTSSYDHWVWMFFQDGEF